LLPGSPSEDPYSALLSGTRTLHREQRTLRDNWLASLKLENKDEILFEFKVLLKATACFSNPRNHPGPPRRAAVVTQDFRLAHITLFEGGRLSSNVNRIYRARS